MSHHAAPENEPQTRSTDQPGVWLLASFRVSSSNPIVFDGRDVPGAVRELEDVTAIVEREGISVRGWYDITGFRSDADVLVWLTGATAEDLQWAYRELRRVSMLRPLVRTSSAILTPERELQAGPGAWCGVVTQQANGAHASAIDVSAPGAVAIDVSADRQVSIFETDAAEDLFTRLRGAGVPSFVGRLVAPVELVEVLQ